jgi:hypothetical protein
MPSVEFKSMTAAIKPLQTLNRTATGISSTAVYKGVNYDKSSNAADPFLF